MFINRLQIENLRNLAQVDIEPNPKLNFLYGGNGAGKTSVLESLVVLSRGRSFRTTQAGELRGVTGKTFRIFAETVNETQRVNRLGLERSGVHWRARKNGKDLTQLSQLTRALPLVLMEPNSHLLVSGAPEVRRKHLDWGMFHVEQEFLDTYRKYAKILKQRNAALRQHQTQVIESIDDVFSDLGIRLTRMRVIHAEAIAEKVQRLLEQLSPGLNMIQFEYEKGWTGETLQESLSHCRESDLHRGSTSSGPHRADILMTLDGTPVRAVLSRGEQKILSAALLLSQAEIFKECGIAPIVLLDDLASEFDDVHFSNVLGKARELGGQVWVTGIRKHQVDDDCALFHVERGTVLKMV